MSGSNPFRRNSRVTRNETTNPGLLTDRQNAGNNLPSLKVEVPLTTNNTSTTKRVRIASPPVPISPVTPVSYASSPEETRQATFSASIPLPDVEVAPYARALALNPFQTSLSDGEREDVDEELLENTRRNSARGSKKGDSRGYGQPDTVNETLARFASLPRRSAVLPAFGEGGQRECSTDKSSRPALDVDAFKRLLMTGESGLAAEQTTLASTHPSSRPAVTSDSSSSNADTASMSQYSICEPLAPVVTDTPRTSHELDREDVASQRGVLIAGNTTDRKPPVPAPRHGKPLSNRSTSPPIPISHGATSARQAAAPSTVEYPGHSSPSSLNKPLPVPPINNAFHPAADPVESPVLQDSASIRRPPTPPLTRRRSQRRSLSVQESYYPSSKSLPVANTGAELLPDQESVAMFSKTPPPPPARRQKRSSDIGLQSSEGTVQEEDALYITSTQPQLSPSSSMTSFSQIKPQPPPSRNASIAKRQSRISTGSPTMGPPPPRPRRVRGSNRSSFDSQTPVLPFDPRSSNKLRRTSIDSSQDNSGSKNVLADLAALQMEVDNLRNQQGGGAGNTN